MISSLSNRDLPQFIKDLLANAPPRKGGAHVYVYKMARLLLSWRSEEEAFRLIRTAAYDHRIPNREIKEALRCAAQRGNL